MHAESLMTRFQMEAHLRRPGDRRCSATEINMNRHTKPSAGRSNMHSASKYCTLGDRLLALEMAVRKGTRVAAEKGPTKMVG